MDSNTGGRLINLDILQGTSVNCERLFSIAKHILSDRWKKTSPRLFEALLFLKANRKLWNVYAVGVAMGRSTATRVQQQGQLDDDAEAIDRLYYSNQTPTLFFRTERSSVILGVQFLTVVLSTETRVQCKIPV
jgi:hypothetical protein